jgi:uronate dehydrogenase
MAEGKPGMKVVMTGAAGGVATMLRPVLAGRFDELVLSDRRPIEDLGPGERFVAADLGDLAQMERLLADADGLIHLGGQSVEADWDAVLQANIAGLYNTYEAARRQGCRRIIFATTNHVVGFYRRQQTIDHTAMLRPDTRYGVSKAFGEALGRMYADKHGLRILNIRIGNVGARPLDIRRLSIWISPRDLAQLIGIGLEHPELHFEIVYGASRNVRAWWNNRNAYRLGYQPQDEAEDHAAIAHEASRAEPEDALSDQFQGGIFCAMEFTGDPKRIT